MREARINTKGVKAVVSRATYTLLGGFQSRNACSNTGSYQGFGGKWLPDAASGRSDERGCWLIALGCQPLRPRHPVARFASCRYRSEPRLTFEHDEHRDRLLRGEWVRADSLGPRTCVCLRSHNTSIFFLLKEITRE